VGGPSENPLLKVTWTVMAYAGIVLGWVELLMAILRETPDFWTNAGGAPVWMRDSARVAFYPLLLVSALNLTGLFWLLLSLPVGSRREALKLLGWIASIVVLFVVLILVVLWDE